MPDIFDRISQEEPDDDIFSEIESEDSAIEGIKTKVADLFTELETNRRKRDNGALVKQVAELVREEVSKIKPTQRVIERQIKREVRHVQVPVQLPPPPPPKIIERPAQVIREIRVEVQAKDEKKYAEEKTVDELKKQLAELQGRYERLVESLPMMGGPGVIGIPPPEAAPDTYVLTNDKGKAKWKQAASGGSVTPSGDTYVVSNLSKVFNYDATNTSLDEIASVLGALIASCRTSGIVS